ncbi:MAG: DoxX family protein [candidate division Zixibacteria bacterium]|nr:DoxX family protein [candidate division Zixibacteria bacterium]
MEFSITQIRKADNNLVAGIVRIFLGIVFLATGFMKISDLTLWEAWSAQLSQAYIPFYELTRQVVPFVEMLTGAMLLVGFFTRIWLLIVIAIMIAASYVHIVVDDPNLFPLQPHEPVVPLAILALAGYVLIKGAGVWSLDSKAK